jgi:hypothetical protein
MPSGVAAPYRSGGVSPGLITPSGNVISAWGSLLSLARDQGMSGAPRLLRPPARYDSHAD